MAFAGVQRGVGMMDELVAVRAQIRQAGDADRDRERAAPAVMATERPGQDVAADDLGVGRRAARQQEGELVAADPIATVGAPEVRADDLADRAKHLVARGVSAPIVRLLEVVDVDHQQGQRRVLLLGLEDLVVELLLERPVVTEARQPVPQ